MELKNIYKAWKAIEVYNTALHSIKSAEQTIIIQTARKATAAAELLSFGVDETQFADYNEWLTNGVTYNLDALGQVKAVNVGPTPQKA